MGLFSVIKAVRVGSTVLKVFDAVKRERAGATDFLGMSKDITEALIEHATDEGINVTDDSFKGARSPRFAAGESVTTEPLRKLMELQRTAPSIGKEVRLDQLKARLNL